MSDVQAALATLRDALLVTKPYTPRHGLPVIKDAQAALATVEQALRDKDAQFARLALEKHAAEAEVARLRDALREIEAIQPRLVGWLRDNGIVFRRAPLSAPPESDDERWEQIAFSIYTYVCETDSLARAALGEEDA